MASRKFTILTPLADLQKQAEIHLKSFVWLDGIPSAPVESKRDSLEKLEIALSKITTLSASLKERVATMQEKLRESGEEAFQNGHDPDPKEEGQHDANEPA